MTILQKLETLAKEKNRPCVTISMNTHRTHPDNAKDIVLLKNLINEAEERIIAEFGKRNVASLLENLSTLEKDIDENYHLDSLHIFLSNDTKEIIKSTWPTHENSVYISDSFNIRSLIKLYSRTEEYLILLLSQSGSNLYFTINDGIVNEVNNSDFPFSENRHYSTHHDKSSDAQHLDNLVREYLNKVDKAVNSVHKETGLPVVVICTEDNYSRLMQVADVPSIYLGYDAINYNNTSVHHISKQAWEIIKQMQKNRRIQAVSEIRASISKGNLLTDIQEIYQASIDGRADLLLVQHDFSQAVIMTSERTFDLTEEANKQGVIEDITSQIAWEVLSKNGRVVFTEADELADLGKMVLKSRY